MPTIDIIVQLNCKAERKETGDSSNACVCLYSTGHWNF